MYALQPSSICTYSEYKTRFQIQVHLFLQKKMYATMSDKVSNFTEPQCFKSQNFNVFHHDAFEIERQVPSTKEKEKSDRKSPSVKNLLCKSYLRGIRLTQNTRSQVTENLILFCTRCRTGLFTREFSQR